MGFDVYGRKPRGPAGEYFRNNIWWWHPLWAYCLEVAPDIASKVEYAYSNDGDGLNDADALALAARLREELESGRTAEYERQYMAALEELPPEPCPACGGAGVVPTEGAGNDPCRLCQGTGKVRSFMTHFPFSEQNVREFVEFLENCGGFEIW